ncbi:3-methyladenine DNA glycosylase [Rubripirellula lacrimiformis]|uniref:Putative 3-methyladenine DNA glycosylase n=1 Tax=Rubripirellula lacrimiformis TaxID=1930273 RepID=A0A517NIM9_9BACT|nr:DNA-3-methyladenine glycosylase [Rubripirellula lacrimiformis]QDT06991.1 3-methyladenine DNA glycosylase [Rubripirellula lacrimiformis]
MNLPFQQDDVPRTFYDRPTKDVAIDLLGMTLLRKTSGVWLGGVIVETEAYLPAGDLASHSHRGRTPSNASMFGTAGTLYVYPIHAKHCLNFVTESAGQGAAVLIRAIQPVWGIPQMQSNRAGVPLQRLTSGPAMTCQAMDVDRTCDGIDVVDSDDWIIAPAKQWQPFVVTSTVRIGITKSASRRLRFFVDGNPFVSGRRRDHQTPPSRVGRSG